jgi:hypothetical protein
VQVAHTWEMKSEYRVLVGKREGKRQCGRPNRRWENNIKMIFFSSGIGGMDWIHLVKDRDGWRNLVNAVKLTLCPTQPPVKQPSSLCRLIHSCL